MLGGGDLRLLHPLPQRGPVGTAPLVPPAHAQQPACDVLRGQNLLGYRHYEDTVVDRFVDKSAENRMDVFRVFDALNDVRNLRRACVAVRRTGKHCEGTISYTTSRSTRPKLRRDGQQLQDIGCDSICIKDMAGLLRPQARPTSSENIKARCGQDTLVHVHVTCDDRSHPGLPDEGDRGRSDIVDTSVCR